MYTETISNESLRGDQRRRRHSPPTFCRRFFGTTIKSVFSIFIVYGRHIQYMFSSQQGLQIIHETTQVWLRNFRGKSCGVGTGGIPIHICNIWEHDSSYENKLTEHALNAKVPLCHGTSSLPFRIRCFALLCQMRHFSALANVFRTLEHSNVSGDEKSNQCASSRDSTPLDINFVA